MQDKKDKPKKELTVSQIAAQQRQAEKEKRRKQFHDISVQGTNDYSIVSKRSVEKLYSNALSETKNVPHYFQHFVKKAARRSPAINRGYWTRMEAIKESSYKIIKDSVSQGKRCVVINLGAGYDPLAFQYLDEKNPLNEGLNGKVEFIDVDYPDLNKIKIGMVHQSQEIKDIIGEEIKSDFEGVDLKTGNYTVLSCDLKNIDLFMKQLEYLQLNDENVTKIYIAEVSIAYMLPQYADPVINSTSKFPNSHFLCLEQVLPSGVNHGFARTMLYHFAKLNSPLNSVETYNTIPLQIQRFKDQGYNGTVEGQDLHSFWRGLPREVQEKINGVEAFDEWEEFIVFGQHYLIVHASNVAFQLFQERENYQFDEPAQDYKFEIKSTEEERKFHASTVINNKTIITTGGASISRLNNTISNEPITIEKHTLPARLSHTLTALNDTKLLLTGGRTAPNRPLQDTWALEKQPNEVWRWNQAEDLPNSRCRHSVFVGTESTPYIYGGNFEADAFLKYQADKWDEVPIKGDLRSKKSAAVTVKANKGVVIGGMNREDQIESTLHTFEILPSGEIETQLLFSHPLLNRYGAQAEYISDDQVLVVGGVSELFLHGQTTTIVKVNLTNKTVTPVKIDDESWGKSPLLIGYQLARVGDEFVTLNGGGVCYSFGSIWNDYLVIKKDDNETDVKLELKVIEKIV